MKFNFIRKKYLFFLFLVAFLISLVLISLVTKKVNGSSESNRFSSTSTVSSPSGNVLSSQTVRLRTNFVTGFTSVKSHDDKFEYALCDVRVGDQWNSGVVLLDDKSNVISTWVIPDLHNSHDLTNTFTSHIVMGDFPDEIFVSLAVKDMIKAINNAYSSENCNFQPIYIVKLKFYSSSNKPSMLEFIKFSYPESKTDNGFAWFSRNGSYPEINNTSKKNTTDKRYYVGFLGYIHFLTYGHLFSYDSIYLNGLRKEKFLMVPVMIKNDFSLGNLYSPVIKKENEKNEMCSFSQLKLWKSICKSGGSSLTYRDSTGEDKRIDRPFTNDALREIYKLVNLNLYLSNGNVKDNLLIQPGWCIFEPDALVRQIYVSASARSSFLNGKPYDAGGIFSQLSTTIINKRRVIRAMRIVSRGNYSPFSNLSHVLNFTVDWNWFSGARSNIDPQKIAFVPFGSENLRNHSNTQDHYFYSDRFSWRESFYENIITDSHFCLSLFSPFRNSSRESGSFFDPFETNFVGYSSGALGSNYPFTIFSAGGDIKINSELIVGNTGENSFYPSQMILPKSLQGVINIVPFKIQGSHGEGMLIVSEYGLAVYRCDSGTTTKFPVINERQILMSKISRQDLKYIFFHRSSPLVEEKLAKVTLGFLNSNGATNFDLRTFSLEWTDDKVMLRPLECTDKTTLNVVNDLPKKYLVSTGRQMASILQEDLRRDFLTSQFSCDDVNQCRDFKLVIQYISVGSEDSRNNRIALIFKIKIGENFQTGFIRKQNQREPLSNTYVVYSGLNNDQEYLVVFKTRSEVMSMPISKYSVNEIFQMYNDPNNHLIRKQLRELAKIEPGGLKHGWDYQVRVIDADDVNNTLSLEALLTIGDYREPLKIKGFKDSSIMVYSNVFCHSDNTWIYIVVACALALIIIASLWVGIGLPMHKQHKIDLINARVTNRRIAQLHEAVSRSNRQIVSATALVGSQNNKFLMESSHDSVKQLPPTILNHNLAKNKQVQVCFSKRRKRGSKGKKSSYRK